MKTRHVLILALLTLILGIPAFAHAQQPTQVSTVLIGRAFNDVVSNDAAPVAAAADQNTPAAPADQGTLATSVDQTSAPAAKAEVHPTPAHTGFRALASDTWADFKSFPRRRSTWVILGIGAGGALLAHPVDDDVNAHLVGKKSAKWFWAPGKVIGAAPTQAGVAIGLYAIGRYVVPPDPTAPAVAGTSPRTNKWSHMGFDLLRAQIVSQTFVLATKYAVRRDRPDGSCCAFPSGHAASAFAAASVIERHFGYRMSVPAMVIATYVATSRLHDNVHFLSDVIMGSAIGTATGWTVVGRHGRSSYALTPVAVPGGFAFQISHVDRNATN
jgi:membrane-associated phospholipid phosphatase